MRENSIEQLKITEKQFKNEADKKVKELFSKAGAEDDEEISRDDVITDEIKASTEARQKQLKKDWSEAERKEAAREDEEATVSEETEPKEKEPKKERELEKYKIIETEALRDRSVELWDERSKILMEKSSQGKTDKFQAIEEEMTEIREELKGRGVKFELNKWMKEEKKEEEAEGEGESPEEEKAEKTAEEKVETQEKTKEEKAEIFPDVLSGFDKLGIKELDLESIKSFSGLSEGQQLLVLENLKQLNLGRIQEEAAVEYRKNTAESKFLGRIWQGISKKYQIAKLEKVTVNKIKKGGMKAHQETLQQLVNGMQKFGTEVKVQDGKLEIQYASGFENLTPEQQKQVDEFNQ
ncbi:hypothetical protein KAU19_03875, partial [Candidatus Parcubacteria bacterium]|nr:hypothetical protein [Candidatus Parcubacteria bacterium]